MAYSTKTGFFNIDTTKTVGQTQAISGLGFQPKVIFFWWSGSTRSTDGITADTVNFGFGVAASSASRWMTNNIIEDASARADSQRQFFTDSIMRAYTNTATLDGILDFSSMDTDGFTVIMDDQFTQAYRISYLALGGSDLTDVSVGTFVTPLVTGNYSVTGLSFQPSALLVASCYSTGVGTNDADARWSLGMATDSTSQNVISFESVDNGVTMDSSRYRYSEITARINSGGVNTRGSFVSFNSDGWTIENLEGTVGYYCGYVALKGGQYKVSTLITRTDSNDIVVTDPGFQPVALLFASVNYGLMSVDTRYDHASASIGAATSISNREVQAFWDEDNLADSETASAAYASAAYITVTDDAVQGLMDIKSIDSTGFTAIMDDWDPAAYRVNYLAIGATPAAGPGKPYYAYAQQ